MWMLYREKTDDSPKDNKIETKYEVYKQPSKQLSCPAGKKKNADRKHRTKGSTQARIKKEGNFSQVLNESQTQPKKPMHRHY